MPRARGRVALATLGAALLLGSAGPGAARAQDGGFAGLQARVVEIYRTGAAVVVRVKAAAEEVSPDGSRQVTQRVGTGFLVSREGHIACNASVVNGAARVWFEHDGLAYAAETLGLDADTNFALLAPTGTPPAVGFLALADAGGAEPGTFVVAVTLPLEFDPAPALGLVTGTEPGFADREFPIPYIRVGVPVYPGEGGSPLIDLNGRLVGMIIASLPEVRSAYVLPARAMERLRDDILRTGHPQRGWLGLDLRDQVERRAPGRPQVVVASVAENGPAALAGIRTNDRILRIDGREVRSMGDIRLVTFFGREGQFIQVTVLREGAERVLPVRLGADPARPPTPVLPEPPAAAPPESPSGPGVD